MLASAPNSDSLGWSLKACGQKKKQNLNLPLPGQELSKLLNTISEGEFQICSLSIKSFLLQFYLRR